MAQTTTFSLTDKVQSRVLCSLIGKSTSVVYDYERRGALPTNFTSHTYVECLTHLVAYLSKNAEAKAIKAEAEAKIAIAKAENGASGRGRPRSGTTQEGEMLPIMEAKLTQDIRLNVAREYQVWTKTAIERGDYINMQELLLLIEPFILTIKQGLVDLSNRNPDFEKPVDELMEHLYTLGVKLMEQADKDKVSVVQEIIDKEVDIEEISLTGEPGKLL